MGNSEAGETNKWGWKAEKVNMRRNLGEEEDLGTRKEEGVQKPPSYTARHGVRYKEKVNKNRER